MDRLELVSHPHPAPLKNQRSHKVCGFVVREWNANDAADPWSTLRIVHIDT